MEIHFPGLRITRFRVGSGELIRNHRHNSFHVFCLLDGEMEQAASVSSRSLRQGGVRISDADSVHEIDFGSAGADCAVLHVTDAVRAGIALPEGSGDRFLSHSGLRPLFERLATNAPGDPAGSWLRVREILAGLRQQSKRPEPTPTPEWLMEVRQHLAEEAYHRTSLIARRTGVSSEHLARSFRRFYGVTPTEAKRAAMLNQALRLLRDSEINIVDAALEAGFAHQSHLTNVMRAMLGTTPGRYRRLIAEGV